MPRCWIARRREIHVRVVVGDLVRCADVAAHHHALQHLLLDVDDDSF